MDEFNRGRMSNKSLGGGGGKEEGVGVEVEVGYIIGARVINVMGVGGSAEAVVYLYEKAIGEFGVY